MEDNDKSYLGTAVAYPVTIKSGAAVIVKNRTVIENSFIMILTTPVGSRYFLPEYGSDLHKRRYEPNDEVLARFLRHDTIDALTRWERRAKILDAEVVIVEDAALIKIIYRDLKSNEIDSFIFPFYRSKRVFV